MASKNSPLYHYRQAAGLTIHELAEKAGLHYTTVHRAETEGCDGLLVKKCQALLSVFGIENLNVLFLKHPVEIDSICALIKKGQSHVVDHQYQPEHPRPDRDGLVGSYRQRRV